MHSRTCDPQQYKFLLKPLGKIHALDSNFTSLRAKNSMVLLDEAVFDRVFIFIEIAV
jgi:phage FluMu gp28-like protein